MYYTPCNAYIISTLSVTFNNLISSNIQNNSNEMEVVRKSSFLNLILMLFFAFSLNFSASSPGKMPNYAISLVVVK